MSIEDDTPRERMSLWRAGSADRWGHSLYPEPGLNRVRLKVESTERKFIQCGHIGTNDLANPQVLE